MNLITAIDYSKSKEKPKYVFSIVSVKASVYPQLKSFLVKKANIRHWRKILKKQKSGYLPKFMKKWPYIKSLLERSDIAYYFEDLLSNNSDVLYNSIILIVDDSLYKKFLKNIELKAKIILEGNVDKEFKPLIMLSDNIANILRKLVQKAKNLKEKFEIEKEFKKR